MGGRRRTARGGEVTTTGAGSFSTSAVALGLVVTIDLASNIVLFLQDDHWCHGKNEGGCPTTMSQFAHVIALGFLSNESTLDLTVLALARLAAILGALGLTAMIRITPGRQHIDKDKDSNDMDAEVTLNGHGGQSRGGNGNGRTTHLSTTITSVNASDVDLEAQPLLGHKRSTGPAGSARRRQGTHYMHGANGSSSSGSDGSNGKTKQTKQGPNGRAMDDDVLHRVTNPLHRNLIVGGVFIVLTIFQAYIGVKCVKFHFDTTFTTILMCITVLWVNVELFLLKNLIDILTRDREVDAPALHHHPLYFVKKLPLHSCDVCSDKVKGSAYRCRQCDFDVCARCFAKQDLTKQEKIVRGDKGVHEVAPVNSTSYIARAGKFALPHWPTIAAAVACLLATSAINLWLPKLNGEIIDTIVKSNKHDFARVIRLFVALSAAYGFFRGLWQFLFRVVGAKMAVDIRNKLFGRVISQDVAYFDQARTGDLISRLSGDVSALVQPIQSMIGTVIASSIQLIGGIFMCFHTCWRLSMLAFVTVAPMMYLTDQYARWSRQLMYQYWEALGEANGKASEALNNVRTVKAFSTEWKELSSYIKSTGDALRKNLTDALGSAATTLLTSYLDLGGTVLILWYGGDLTMAGEVTVGTLVAFRLYWGMINSNYKSLMQVLNSFTRAGGAAQRVLSLLDAAPDIDIDAGEVYAPRGHIALDNVFFHYQMRPNNKVLKGVSLEIAPGQVCALVGRSGGGKSTIVHLLMRFYDPAIDVNACQCPEAERHACTPQYRQCAGRVLLDGKDLRGLNLRSVHERCGLVSQETQLFDGTVRDNICYGLQDKVDAGEITDTDIEQAARDANAHGFISDFEDGYDTKVGEKGVRLSGGQKQRIALARVFLRQPTLLFLDEATSALDAESEAEVQDALDRLIARGHSTVLLIAHRLSTVINADKIAVIDEGKIAELGTHSELVERGGIYASLVAKQMARQNNVLDSDALSPDGDGQGDASVDELLLNSAKG
eukprot:m.81314 g.81314  ORF g.81314 m.81314 type:complete len:1003 (+) comp9403_c0_seq1:317-3325(+)